MHRFRNLLGCVGPHGVLRLALPASLGLLSVVLQGAGLMFTTASVNMMVQASIIPITAVLSVLILRRRLSRQRWLGIALSVLSILIVSAASLLTAPEQAALPADLIGAFRSPPPPKPQSRVALGIGLTVASQAVGAAQMVLEELLLRDMGLHPLQLLGWEGVLGVGLMLGLGLPLAQLLPGSDVSGRLEDSLDTLAMLAHSSGLLAVAVAFFWAGAVTNITGVLVTARLGSVFRTILMTARTALVWLLGLALHAIRLQGGRLGESWDPRASPLQLLGFAVGILGTVTYAKGGVGAEPRRAEPGAFMARVLRVMPTEAWGIAQHALLYAFEEEEVLEPQPSLTLLERWVSEELIESEAAVEAPHPDPESAATQPTEHWHSGLPPAAAAQL